MSTKNLTLALLVLVFLAPIRADEYLKNGDFSDGISHWEGDVKNLADQGSDPDATSLTTTTTTPKPGLLIELKASQWTKVIQEFKTKSSTLNLTVSYSLSPDLAFSDTPSDYDNVPNRIGFGKWLPFDIPIHKWTALLSDFSRERIFISTVAPKYGSADPQSFTHTFDGLVGDEETKTLCFAFPPGHGNVIIANVSLKN